MDFDDYQTAARSTAIYKPEVRVIYPALGLAGETGEVMEHVKKMLRDGDGKMDAERLGKIKKEIGDVLWYVANLAADLDLSMNEIAEENLAKLKSRQERGVLHGAGSDR
jgi:NTP pyrophosphatase (non-canonical NTP hydrolase)